LILKETRLLGAYIIEPEILEDERGCFARTFCREEFKRHGLNPDISQCSISFNKKKGTLRGMHYQIKPYEEAKLVRCTQGAMHDVIVDLRPSSPTFKEWIAAELSEKNKNMVYIPEGFAHGFQTLTDNVEVFYQMSQFYSQNHGRGFRWNDPSFNINWPPDTRVISPKDQSYLNFTP
tara:strand:- start:35 stop:565 length:531 start_codon:yes stop_codon:yes gene_type:complete